MPGEEKFLNKLGEIPVVNDGWTAAWDYYAKVKDYNALTRLSLAMAESSVKVAGKISTPVLTPVITKCQPQIDNVNDFACKKLDEFEDKYPLIKQPTSEVKDACTEYIQPVMDRVKPVVKQAQDVIDNSRKQAARVKTCGTNIVYGAKDFGVDTVSRAFNASFDTTPGRFVTRTIDGVLDKADDIVDKYLPEKSVEAVDNGAEDTHSDSSEDDHVPPVEAMEMESPTPARVAIHLKCVSEKIRRRMFRLAVRDFRKAKSETMNAMNKLNSTLSLVDYAKGNLTAARDKVEEMWNKIVNQDENGSPESGNLFAGTLEDRIVALGAMLAGQVKTGISLLEKTSSEFSSFAQHPISKTKEYSDVIKSFTLVRSIQDFSSDRLAHLGESLRSLQKKCRDFMDGIQSPDWLRVDIDMQQIELQENDVALDQLVSSNNNSEDELEREENHQAESGSEDDDEDQI